ncbi:hypothetical protein ZOSMA_171G00280 [Zostera marina]|uniref:Mediator complex subunit 15 KIX domain-containing protein n=1 Tax=Zostera marina TaxID=29655 RepID=A0A0K9PUN8_ZOSMR|nr:hypothetical protein ZOSMA_171G00280 [Zostera marina]
MEGSENVGEANSTEWRSQLQSEARQRVVNKIMVTLRKHLTISGNEGLGELRNIAVRFEENIYNDAQSDYRRKISMKMLTMEQKTHGGGVNGNSLSSTSGAVNQSSDPGNFKTQK